MAAEKTFEDFLGSNQGMGSTKNDFAQKVTDQVNNISLRLRMLEEYYSNLRKKMQIIDQNMISISKKTNKEIKAIDLSLGDLKMDLEDTREKIELVIKELDLCTRKDEFIVLEKYVNLWKVMDFVSRDEVSRMIKEYKSKNNKL